MTKKLEINFTKKPEIVFQFDQFLNVEQAVDKFLNKKENIDKLIAPLIPTNLEETIQKLIPEVSDGYTPQKGVDYDDGKDGETPSDEKIIALIKPQIPKVIPGKDGTTPKKGIDYFTKKELEEIKKELKTTILSEMPEHATKEEVNIKITEVLDKIRKLPTGGGGAQFLRQLMDVNVGNPTAQQYGLTYNPSRGEFALTAITGGGGAVDSVNGQTGVVVLDTGDIAEATDLNYVSDAQLTVIGNTSGTNTGDVTVSDSSEIDLTLTGQQISASIVSGSIGESKLDASVNVSLGKADTAVQPATLSSYELLANKATDFSTINNTLYPTVQAVNNAINTAVTGLLDYRGSYDASTNLFPATGGSGLLGAILKGDFWICSVAGTLGGVPVTAGDLIIAIVDTPGQTASNWDLIENTLGYTPENAANKVTSISGASTDTQYPSAKLLYDQLALKQPLDTQLTSVAGLSYASNALKVIRVNAGETDFELATISAGTGDVVGPASAIDNAIARFDSTTGKLIQNSAATIADTTGDITAGKYNTVAISGASTPTLAVTGTSSISGANTGDQTSVSGNAGTATALATPRTIGTATGDVTSAGSSFDGSANNTNALTIANSAVTLAKMASLAQDQFIGRTTASTGVPETATITAAARTVLDDTTVGAMVDTLGGATSTGTGGIVRTGSPALITPSIAAITVSGGILTLPTGASDTIVTKNSTDTLTNKSISGGQITSAVANATDSTKIGGITVTGTPAVGYVPTATSTTAATWQATSGGTPKTKFSTTFEAISRFTTGSDGTGSTPTVDTAGLNLRTGSNGAAKIIWSRFTKEYQQMPSLQLSMNAYASDTGNSDGKGDLFFGLGNFGMAITSSGITFTDKHIGVKIIKNLSNTYDIIGTQADGTTEAVTSTIATTTGSQLVSIIIDITSITNVDFYVSVEYGAYATASLGSTNRPTGALGYPIIGVSSHGSNSSQRFGWDINGASFEH